jgi:ferritin-like metal-binding protein YciE
MGILSGNPQEEPMHYGEVYGSWAAVFGGKAMVAAYQTMLNHAGDEDLKKLIQEAIEQCKQDTESIEKLLKENGVGLPPSPPERPAADLESIPAGARFMDNEIAGKMSADVAAGLVSASTMIGQCIREDIATLYGTIHTKKAAFGAKLLRLSKEKGWLVPPPLHMANVED